MILIGLDVSTTSTGVAIWKNGQICDTFTIQTKQLLMKSETVKAITEKININEKITIITEHFTSTINHNDRTNSAKQIIQIIDDVTAELKSAFNADVIKFTPWAWRRVFNLHTAFEARKPSSLEDYAKNFANKENFDKIARSIGHDLLKRESVEYVKNNKQSLNLKATIDNDDEAEAVLLINAYIKTNTKKEINDEKFYNVRYLKIEDIT